MFASFLFTSVRAFRRMCVCVCLCEKFVFECVSVNECVVACVCVNKYLFECVCVHKYQFACVCVHKYLFACVCVNRCVVACACVSSCVVACVCVRSCVVVCMFYASHFHCSFSFTPATLLHSSHLTSSSHQSPVHAFFSFSRETFCVVPLTLCLVFK